MGEARVEVRLHEPRRGEALPLVAGAALEVTAAESVDAVLEIVTQAARNVVGAHQAVTSRLVAGWGDATTYVSLSDRYAGYADFDELPRGHGVLNAVTATNRPLRL